MSPRTSSGLVNKAVLDKIDKLFSCNVGEYIDLPQLVVVGDQSSGKSSVLSGLTQLPFPRDNTLCTRCATQIIFRRAEHISIVVSIIPGHNSSSEHANSIRAWQRVVEILDAITFASILEEASAAMGLRGPAENGPAFSSDTLKIEVSGPSQEHFSVIDVPGIFRKTEEGVTTKEDRALVDDLVAGYMRNPRSILLAVVPANVDVAMQDILERAVEVDPHGRRTLGILTKPDLVDKGAEHTIVDMVEGKQHKLHLGWHILRNPGHSQSNDARSRIETEFFRETAPWNKLDSSRVGIEALIRRLQEVLADHLRREFPKVKLEITQKLKNAEMELHNLGAKRQTQSELTQFVLDLAIRFQELVSLVDGTQYRQSNMFDETSELRLATAVVNRSEAFAETMENVGHIYTFDLIEDTSEIFTFSSSMSNTSTRQFDSEPEIAHILQQGTLLDPPKAGIMSWLKTVYTNSRGFELGTFNASIIGITMKLQAGKWREIALGYVSDIINLVHCFVLQALRKVALQDRVRLSLQALLLDQLIEMYEKALSHTRYLLQVELNGIPLTHNPEFLKSLENLRTNRSESFLNNESFSTKCKNHPDPVISVSRFSELQRDINTQTLQSNRLRDIHDIVRAYYSVAMTRFVDNVRMQVCDYFLIQNSSSADIIRPLELFSAKFATSLSIEHLEEVAGEDLDVRMKRSQLEKEISQLTIGKHAV